MKRSLEERLGDLVPSESLDRFDNERLPSCPRVAPRNVEQFQDVLRLARTDKLKVLPLGTGSKLGWLPTPERVDLVLSSLGYRGVIAHEPADGTVTALAGTTMADLGAVVGEGGHHLSPSVPRPDRATLGGVVAAGQSGDDRLRYGALRDNLLGTRVLLADGTLAKSGGRLVKNVTGYDLHRLFSGSFGSLAFVLEASLRLHPLPEERALFLVRTPNRGDALDLAREIRSAPLRPVTLLAHDLDSAHPDAPWTVMAVLAGRIGVIDAETAVLRRLAPKASIARGSDVTPVVKAVRDLELSHDTWPGLSIETRPSRLQEVLVNLVQTAGILGYAVKLLVHPALARAIVWLLSEEGRGPADPSQEAERIADLQAALLNMPLVARWRDLTPLAQERVQPRGRPPLGLGLMRDLTSALDPEGILAPRLFRG